MVAGIGLAPMATRSILLAEAAGGEKLPPPTRAAVQMALLGIALLGMLIVVIILLGGHWVRSQGSYRRGPAVPPDHRPLPPKSIDRLASTPGAPAPGDGADSPPAIRFETILTTAARPSSRERI